MINGSEEEPRPASEQHDEDEPEQGFMRELSQFFIVPSLIVVLCVGVFLMFGLVTSEDKTAREFLQEIRTGRGNERWLAAFELSRLISQQPQLGADDRLVQEIIGIIRNEGAEEPQVRKYLVIALEHLGNRGAGPVILELLDDPDPEVRLHATRAMGVLEPVPGAVGPLSRLLADEDPAIRKVAIYALGQTRDPEAIPVLLPRLEDPLEDIRWNAALALAVLGDGSGRPVIVEMLDREHLDAISGITEEQKIRALINGVQAVYLLRETSLVEEVRELSSNDPSLKVREIAIKVLKELEKAQSGAARTRPGAGGDGSEVQIAS